MNLTINGSGFVNGAAFDVVGTGGGYWATNFISSTQLSITNFNVSAVGTISVYVIDPAPAGTSSAAMLTVTQPPVPTITSIDPNSGQSGSQANITITGTGFQLGANVLFNNSNYSVNVVSSTQILTTIQLGGVAAGTYPISVVDPLSGASAPFSFIVTGPPDFSVASSGTTSLTVPAGTTANFTNAISIAALNSFSSSVALSCSLPAKAVTCSVAPNSFPTGSGTASVQVTTMARGMLPPAAPFVYFRVNPGVLSALALLMLIFVWRFARTRRQRLALSLPFASVVLIMVMQLVGCGGGGYTQPPPPPPPTGTAVGIYTITVTATATTTSGTLTHSGTLTLTVQ